ncbi:MAG: GNAT family N-acetyltransferase [Myxococcales bacterium]|nr:GNAT family N-acetyltransferase [Myxococcales bacterium]
MKSTLHVAFRAALPSDYAAFVQLWPEFGAGDPPPGPEQFSVHIAPGTILAEEGKGGLLLGYVSTTVWGSLLKIDYLVVAPEARGKSVSVALVEQALWRAHRAGGVRDVQLTVMPDNARAIYLYEKLGLARDYAVLMLRCDASVASRLPRSPPVTVAHGSTVDASRVDASLALPEGTVAAGLAYGFSVVSLSGPDGVVGTAVFDPLFDRLSHFAVSSPAVLRTLLEAVMAERREAGSTAPIDFMVEGFADVQQALIAAGAVVTLELVAMTGKLDVAMVKARALLDETLPR